MNSPFKILKVDELPQVYTDSNKDERHPLHEMLLSDDWHSVFGLLILNELRGINPEHLSSDEKLSSITKLKTLQELMDLKHTFTLTEDHKQTKDDELPDEPTEGFRPESYLE